MLNSAVLFCSLSYRYALFALLVIRHRVGTAHLLAEAVLEQLLVLPLHLAEALRHEAVVPAATRHEPPMRPSQHEPPLNPPSMSHP